MSYYLCRFHNGTSVSYMLKEPDLYNLYHIDNHMYDLLINKLEHLDLHNHYSLHIERICLVSRLPCLGDVNSANLESRVYMYLINKLKRLQLCNQNPTYIEHIQQLANKLEL